MNFSSEKAVVANTRVWYVDDSDQVRELLVDLLNQHCGLNIAKNFACPHAMLAELTKSEAPDVLLMDVNLANDESGLDIIQPALQAAPSTRVVMITTFSDSHNETQALMRGASAFILKSEPPQRIAETIRHACRSPLRMATSVKPAREHSRAASHPATASSDPGFRSEKLGMLRHLFGWRRFVTTAR